MTEVNRMKNDASISSINRHKLIDCAEFFSKSMAKKAATTKNSETQSQKFSIQRTSSIVSNVNDISNEPNISVKQHRLRNLLARDFNP